MASKWAPVGMCRLKRAPIQRTKMFLDVVRTRSEAKSRGEVAISKNVFCFYLHASCFNEILKFWQKLTATNLGHEMGRGIFRWWIKSVHLKTCHLLNPGFKKTPWNALKLVDVLNPPFCTPGVVQRSCHSCGIISTCQRFQPQYRFFFWNPNQCSFCKKSSDQCMENHLPFTSILGFLEGKLWDSELCSLWTQIARLRGFLKHPVNQFLGFCPLIYLGKL